MMEKKTVGKNRQSSSKKQELRVIATKAATRLKLIILFVFLAYLLLNRDILPGQGEWNRTGMMKAGILLVLALVCVVFIFWNMDFGKRANRVLSVLYALSAPCYAFLLMEIAIQSYFDRAYLTNEIILYNLLIIVMVELLLTVLTNSLKWGPSLCMVACVIFAVSNSFVYQFRSIPMMASDFTTIMTAVSVAGNYTLKFDYHLYLPLLAMFAFLLAGSRMKETKLVKRGAIRIGATVLMVAGFCLFTSQFVCSDFLREHGVSLRMFRPMDSYRKYGNMVVFARSIAIASPEKPENYSVKTAGEIAKNYSSDPVDKKKQRPNVIVVINESFSDLKVLGDFETNEDYMPFVHSLQKAKNCVTGTTYASILGGQTANTEFEFLTNNSLAFLPSQSVAFQLYVKSELPSLVTSMKEQGYIGNDAIHLWTEENYHRNVVYPLLGFDHFYHKGNSQTELTLLRAYPSDECVNENVIYNYEKFRETSDEPYLCYTITVQNHSPFDKKYDNFPEEIQLENMNVDAPDVEQYLSLVKRSDQAFQKLYEYFQKVDEPTVLLMMGDHQPNVSRAFLKKITEKSSGKQGEKMMQRYAVPFVICANYDLPYQKIEKTSMNYMQTILMETIGGELTGYQKFLQKVREQVPVLTGLGYYGNDGKFYNLDDTTSPYYQLLQEYAVLQYNNLMDSKNRVQDFFYLSGEND